MKEIGAFLGALVAIIALSFVLNYYGVLSAGFFAPKYRAIDAKVFKASEQYNDGMVRDLENLRMQYLGGNDDQKAALRATILHRFATYDPSQLTPELQLFYRQIQGQ